MSTIADTRACARCGKKRRTNRAAHRKTATLCADCQHNPTDPIRWDGAACRGCEPEWWFADQPEARKVTSRKVLDAQLGIAKAICRDCPLRAECADYGTRNRLVGVWGGLDTKERGLKERV